MITEDDAERAVQWLVENASAAAKARAERIYLDEYRKSLKARLMRESGQESLGAQEREAYAHPDYGAHLDAMRDAIEADEKIRWLHSAAEARIDAWRTQQANLRKI